MLLSLKGWGLARSPHGDAGVLALQRGPAAYGWIEGQRWTLPRITRPVFELFRVRYTPRGVSYLLHRIGYSPQVPQHVAVERDEAQVETWARVTWPDIKGLRTV